MDTTYKAIANQIVLMPIRALSFSLLNNNLDLVDCVQFAQLESESNFTINPITKQDFAGKQRLVTNKIEGTFYIPYNKFVSNQVLLKLVTIKNSYQRVTITLGNGTIPSSTTNNVMPDVSNSTSGANIILNSFDIITSVESVEFRQRIKIVLTGYLKDITNIFS